MTHTDERLSFPATERNREPILEVLRAHAPSAGVLLEIASGSGQHAAFWATAMPNLVVQPSDPDPAHRGSVTAWTRDHANVRPPLDLDVTRFPWPIGSADAVVCINMIHIAPWECTVALMDGAARVLPPDGLLFLYGPYKRGGAHTAPSNASFDESLRSRDPRWGVRDMEEVATVAREAGLFLRETVPMPANNFSLVLRKDERAP